MKRKRQQGFSFHTNTMWQARKETGLKQGFRIETFYRKDARSKETPVL